MSAQEIQLCLASPSFFPAYGGAELRFMRYLPGFRERGIYTRVVTGTPKAKKLTESDKKRDWYRLAPGTALAMETINNTPVQRTRLPDNTGWRRTIIFNQAMLRFCQQPNYRPDVVQLLAPLPPRSVPWLARLRSLGIPIIFAYTFAPKWPGNPIRRALNRLASRLLYQQLDCIIANRSVGRDSISNLGVKNRIEVIPNGVDIDQYHPPTDAQNRLKLRESLGIGENQIMITTIGSIRPTKGSDLLLEAWGRIAQKYPQIHLVLLGIRIDQTDPKLLQFRQKLKGLVEASGAASRIHFAGLVSNVASYLQSSDIFVFPSKREGMPNAVLEAMATGLPVILTPFTGLTEDFGRSNDQYLLADHSPVALAAAIENVLAHRDLRARLGHSARDWVQKNMAIGKSIDRYADIYVELAGQSKRRVVAKHPGTAKKGAV
jgi:glycosyltransferase involved in cell wall biosynthesis